MKVFDSIVSIPSKQTNAVRFNWKTVKTKNTVIRLPQLFYEASLYSRVALKVDEIEMSRGRVGSSRVGSRFLTRSYMSVSLCVCMYVW